MGEISRWIKYSFSLNVLQGLGRQLKLREQSKSKVNVKGEEYAGWKNEEKRVKWNSFCAIWFPFEANFQRISQFVSKIEGSLLEYFKFSHLNYPIYNRKTRIFVASKNYATFPNTFSHLYKKKNFPQSYTIHRINTRVRSTIDSQVAKYKIESNHIDSIILIQQWYNRDLRNDTSIAQQPRYIHRRVIASFFQTFDRFTRFFLWRGPTIVKPESKLLIGGKRMSRANA